jgi:DNA-binding PadR family transcriptional regulator
MSEPRALARLRRKLTVENLWLYIIKILKDNKPLRAYDIKVSLRDVFDINAPAVTVYSVLYRMKRDGLLEIRREGEVVVYTPTERGLEAFKQGIVFIEEVLAKLKI